MGEEGGSRLVAGGDADAHRRCVRRARDEGRHSSPGVRKHEREDEGATRGGGVAAMDAVDPGEGERGRDGGEEEVDARAGRRAATSCRISVLPTCE